MHSVRATLTTRLHTPGRISVTVCNRTSHWDVKSLSSYHNLRGSLGTAQQNAFMNFNREINCIEKDYMKKRGVSFQKDEVK